MKSCENKDIMVSICCITYNHEKYIAQAINSFLMQETDFDFEILINDDASTDGTAQIIAEYEKKYPELIKPIYQKKNRHSEGKKSMPILYEKAAGKYIALCEGDDYWISPEKLQKQVDCMEKHHMCSLCIHATYYTNNNEISGYSRASESNSVLTLENMMRFKGTMFHTSSMLFPKAHTDLPKYYYNAPVGDAPLKIHLATKGNIYYIDEYMSVYRTRLEDSWSSKNMTNKQKKLEHCDKMCSMLDEINEFTEFRYKSLIEFRIMHYGFTKLIIEGNYKKMRSKMYREYYKTFSFKRKIMMFIECNFPNFALLVKRKLRKIKNVKRNK